RLLTRAEAQLRRLKRSCSGEPTPKPTVLPEPLSPQTGEASFGLVRARAPAGSDHVEVGVDGRPTRTLALATRSVAVRSQAPTGLHEFTLRFLGRGRVLQILQARDVWVLP